MLIYLSLSCGMNSPEKELPLAMRLQLDCTSLLENIFLGMASINLLALLGRTIRESGNVIHSNECKSIHP